MIQEDKSTLERSVIRLFENNYQPGDHKIIEMLYSFQMIEIFFMVLPLNYWMSVKKTIFLK